MLAVSTAGRQGGRDFHKMECCADMFDLVGFDLDGTLVDTAADVAHATNHALAMADLSPLPVETSPRSARSARIRCWSSVARSN